MNKRRVAAGVFLLLLSTLAGGVAGVAGTLAIQREKVDTVDLAKATASDTVTSHASILSYLREGEVDTASELLEINLEGALVTIWAYDPMLEDDLTRKAVRTAKKYRDKFPRDLEDHSAQMIRELFDEVE